MSEKGRAIYGFSAGEQLSRASFIGAVHPDEQKMVGAVFDRVRGCGEII